MHSPTYHQSCVQFSTSLLLRFFSNRFPQWCESFAMNIYRHLNFLICVSQLVNCIILETKQGSLKGETLLSRGGRPYHAFYSVPYAEPPVGELRFQSPVPPSTWQGVRDATVLPPPCMSVTDDGMMDGEEDCLYLNVYTSKIGNNTLLPVMVFIFGGRLMYGHALPSRYGPQYFMDEDIVLITFHYRLGVLGFLSTEDEVIPGNYGLKDSIAVLRWVQNYIDSYGGDKSRVTLFGGSSGGMSASFALISPLSKGLVHRVISQSGFLLDVVNPGKATQTAWKFASFVGCNNEKITTSEALLTCLKERPAEELVKNNINFYEFGRLTPLFPWCPVIESEKVPGAFLVDDPRKLLRRKIDVPWIVGINSDEGGMLAIYTYFTPGLSVNDELAKNYKKYFPMVFGYDQLAQSPEQVDKLTEIYKNYYFGDTEIRDNVHAFSKMCTGLFYLPAIKEIAKLYQGPTYVYYYDHRNKETFGPMYAKYDEDMGVIHGDELISMYNWSEVIKPVTEGIDLVVSKQVLKLWTNFAAAGDPNNDAEQIWRPVDSPDINYLHIKGGVLETKEALLKSEYEFLESVPLKLSKDEL